MLFVGSFLLGRSPASVYYCMPTFWNSLSVPSSKAMVEDCAACRLFSFGQVPGVNVLLYADVSELSIGSIF